MKTFAVTSMGFSTIVQAGLTPVVEELPRLQASIYVDRFPLSYLTHLTSINWFQIP